MDGDTLTLDGGAAIVTGAGNGAGRDAGRSPRPAGFACEDTLALAAETIGFATPEGGAAG